MSSRPRCILWRLGERHPDPDASAGGAVFYLQSEKAAAAKQASPAPRISPQLSRDYRGIEISGSF